MSEAGNIEVSVIIATKDRPNELRSISLPSLAKQTTRAFEILIWDASEDDASRMVVDEFSALYPDCQIRYIRAPRRGLPSQRNDAARAARGNVLFFIDDDSQVSCDGVMVLVRLFAKHEELVAGCLPLEYHWPGERNRPANPHSAFLARGLALYDKIFGPSLAVTGTYASPALIGPGQPSSLAGCDMAFRKAVFPGNQFEERLQRFGGYALWEDRLFCLLLTRKGNTLKVPSEGGVVHHPTSVNRHQSPWKRGLMEGYNAGLVWRLAVLPLSRWTVVPFLWARLGFLGVASFPCLCKPWQVAHWKRLAGYLVGLQIFLWEAIGGLREERSI